MTEVGAWFDIFVLVTAVAAAAIASVTGFGIGSLLTPTLGIVVGTKVAVAAVSVPHLLGTALRFWKLKADVNRKVLWRFGIPSAAGGLAGALLHSSLKSPGLSVIFGGLLLFVSFSEFTGLAKRMRFHGLVAWIAGALSGLLGGLVGNQGGIRSAALFGFDLEKQAFVATATATGLIVDGARMPVYLATAGGNILAAWVPVLVASVGVVIGTVFGSRLLHQIPEKRFRPIVAGILAALGVAMLFEGFRE